MLGRTLLYAAVSALLTSTVSGAACDADGGCDAALGVGVYRQPPADELINYEYAELDTTYNKQGISKASAGNFADALELFRAASYHYPHRGDIWANIGLALLDMVRGDDSLSASKALSMLRDARAAFELGAWLRNKNAEKFLRDCESELKSRFPKKCIAKDCARFRLEVKALRLLKSNKHVEAVNLMCAHPDNMTVPLTSLDRRAPLTPSTVRRFYLTMRICGVVRLENVMDSALLDRIAEAQKAEVARFKASRMSRTASVAEEWTDAASRSDLRYEIKFPLREPYTDPGFTTNRYLLGFAKCMLTMRMEIDTFSHVTSFAGAPDQAWHADVSPLFPRFVVGEEEHLPPMGLVVVLPLVDMDMANGPTEYMTGSHVNMEMDYWENIQNEPVTPLHRLEADRGSAVIFDLRIRHRGTANKSDKDRGIVYMSYVREWYSDRVNFKESQTREFDTLSLRMKKLLGRADHIAYVKQLEAMLTEQGVNIASLQSEGNYKRVGLEA